MTFAFLPVLLGHLKRPERLQAPLVELCWAIFGAYSQLPKCRHGFDIPVAA